VIAFHGTDDTFVSYEGGFGEGARSLPPPGGVTTTTVAGTTTTSAPRERPLTVPAITAAWAGRNGCAAGEPTTTEIADDVSQLAWVCPPGAEAELYRVQGGGHAWPGSDFSKAIAAVVGRTTFSIDATALMWEFFVAHPIRD
jgi:polyhydroxybutyrate depolymerase